MTRNLYRTYLYVVFLAMLILAAVGLGWLLQPLLALTALRGSYSEPPAHMALVQGVVFFGISWLIAGLLGGFHYWLIRRDVQNRSRCWQSGRPLVLPEHSRVDCRAAWHRPVRHWFYQPAWPAL